MNSATDMFVNKIDKYIPLSYTIGDKEKEYIFRIMQNNPEIFIQLEEGIKEIMKDGKFDLHDIPTVVLLLSKLFHTHQEGRDNNVDLYSVVEFVLHTMIDCSWIPLPEIEATVLKKIIQSSLELLKTNITPSQRKSCFGFC